MQSIYHTEKEIIMMTSRSRVSAMLAAVLGMGSLSTAGAFAPQVPSKRKLQHIRTPEVIKLEAEKDAEIAAWNKAVVDKNEAKATAKLNKALGLS